jgi:hypothetical protein
MPYLLKHCLHTVIELIVFVPSLVPWFTLVHESQISSYTDNVMDIEVHCGGVDLGLVKFAIGHSSIRVSY